MVAVTSRTAPERRAHKGKKDAFSVGRVRDGIPINLNIKIPGTVFAASGMDLSLFYVVLFLCFLRLSPNFRQISEKLPIIGKLSVIIGKFVFILHVFRLPISHDVVYGAYNKWRCDADDRLQGSIMFAETARRGKMKRRR